MEKGKRERSANFNIQERDILVSLVQKYKDILENKQSDATTWKKKDTAWETIEQEFNAQYGGTYRTSKTLKVKYEGLKRSVRKKSAAIRSELYRTGGGKNVAVPLDNVEEQLKTIITLSTDGLESIYDSDVLPETQESDDGNARALNLLITPNVLSIDSVESENGTSDTKLIVSESLHSLNDNKTEGKNDIVEMKQLRDIDDIIIENDTLINTPNGTYAATPSTSLQKKWDTTSRRNLKSKKHPALIGNHHRKTHFDELAQAKLELVQLQKTILETELLEKKKEWDFKEKERKWKEQEYMLKLEKLKKELKE